MNAALLMTLPTPQLLNLSARQDELQTSPGCQEHLISISGSDGLWQAFKAGPHLLAEETVYNPEKKICSLLHGCCDPPTSFPWPHLLGDEISQPSINPCSSEFTFKSWSCSRESLNEWVNACKYMRECCNLCNLNILPICLLAFSLMDWLSFDILFKITSVKAFHESGVGIVQCCFRIG